MFTTYLELLTKYERDSKDITGVLLLFFLKKNTELLPTRKLMMRMTVMMGDDDNVGDGDSDGDHDRDGDNDDDDDDDKYTEWWWWW